MKKKLSYFYLKTFNKYSYNINKLVNQLKTPKYVKNTTSNQNEKSHSTLIYFFYGKMKIKNHLNKTSFIEYNLLTLKIFFFIIKTLSVDKFSSFLTVFSLIF